MSRRSHYRNFNVNELAEALTRHGWQPPQPGNGGYGTPNQNNQLNGNLAALSSLLGNMNNGSFPATNTMAMMPGNMSPMSPGAAMSPMPSMPSMPQMSAPFPNRPPQTTASPPQPAVTDTELLKGLFQQILKKL